MNIRILLILLIPSISCSQSDKNLSFKEGDYIEIKRGADEGYPFVIVYANKVDTNYKLKKIFFFDSTYLGDTYAKTFYYKGREEGPFESIIAGKMSQKGTFKNGKYDGERLHFTEGILTQKAYFTDGVKTGTWEQYDEDSKLIKKTTYNKSGSIIKGENYK